MKNHILLQNLYVVNKYSETPICPNSKPMPTVEYILRLRIPYSREQKHVSISDTPMLLIEINSISNMGRQK